MKILRSPYTNRLILVHSNSRRDKKTSIMYFRAWIVFTYRPLWFIQSYDVNKYFYKWKWMKCINYCTPHGTSRFQGCDIRHEYLRMRISRWSLRVLTPTKQMRIIILLTSRLSLKSPLTKAMPLKSTLWFIKWNIMNIAKAVLNFLVFSFAWHEFFQ